MAGLKGLNQGHGWWPIEDVSRSDSLFRNHIVFKDKEVDKISYAYKEVSFTLKRKGTRGVITGGCLRDLLFGATPKDYDFFFERNDVSFSGFIGWVRGGSAGDFTSWKNKKPRGMFSTGELNIIQVHTLAVLNEFPFYLSKIYWSPDHGLWVHDDFIKAYKDRIFYYKETTIDKRYKAIEVATKLNIPVVAVDDLGTPVF